MPIACITFFAASGVTFAEPILDTAVRVNAPTPDPA